MDFFTALQSTPFGTWVRESSSIWAYPTVLTAHTVGLGILVGASSAFDLSVLGFFPGTPLSPLKRLFPLMWLGFWINALSGAALFVADAAAKSRQPIFFVKMCFIAASVVNIFLIKRAVFGRAIPVPDRPVRFRRARVLAGASLVLWVGAITAGRLMAYVK